MCMLKSAAILKLKEHLEVGESVSVEKMRLLHKGLRLMLEDVRSFANYGFNDGDVIEMYPAQSGC